MLSRRRCQHMRGPPARLPAVGCIAMSQPAPPKFFNACTKSWHTRPVPQMPHLNTFEAGRSSDLPRRRSIGVHFTILSSSHARTRQPLDQLIMSSSARSAHIAIQPPADPVYTFRHWHTFRLRSNESIPQVHVDQPSKMEVSRPLFHAEFILPIITRMEIYKEILDRPFYSNLTCTAAQILFPTTYLGQETII